MALQRLHTRGRSEGKAACLGRSGTHAVMVELALGPGDRRGATGTTTSRCLPKTEAAGHQMTRVGEPFSKGQKPGCLCIFRWNPDGRPYGVQKWFLLEMAPGGEAASRERSSWRGLGDRVRVWVWVWVLGGQQCSTLRSDIHLLIVVSTPMTKVDGRCEQLLACSVSISETRRVSNLDWGADSRFDSSRHSICSTPRQLQATGYGRIT